MTKPIQKIKLENVPSDSIRRDLFIADKVNALIDAVEALEKRVEGLESDIYCQCDEYGEPGKCLHCGKVRQP